AQGRVDLRALAPLSPEASLSGTADVDVALHGPLAAPEGGGRVSLRSVSVRSREFPQPLTDLSAELSLSSTRVDVERFAGRLGGGTLEGSGRADLKGAALANLDLKLTAHDLSLRYPGDFQSRLSADLTLRGPLSGLLLAGDVQVERGLY